MTPEAQRIAIAEACGWRKMENGRWFNSNHAPMPGFEGVKWHNLPDYTRDLNAMHSAENYAKEQLMDADQWERYGKLLEQLHPTAIALNTMHDGTDYWDLAEIANAPASRRAEAFLRALGKWVETGEEARA